MSKKKTFRDALESGIARFDSASIREKGLTLLLALEHIMIPQIIIYEKANYSSAHTKGLDLPKQKLPKLPGSNKAYLRLYSVGDVHEILIEDETGTVIDKVPISETMKVHMEPISDQMYKNCSRLFITP